MTVSVLKMGRRTEGSFQEKDSQQISKQPEEDYF